MHYFSKLFFLLLFFSTVVSFGYAQSKTDYPADLAQLHQNILNELLGGPLGTDTLQALVDRMNEQGAWSHIPYQSKQRGSWEPTLHLSYVQTMANPFGAQLLARQRFSVPQLVVSRNWCTHAVGSHPDFNGRPAFPGTNGQRHQNTRPIQNWNDRTK